MQLLRAQSKLLKAKKVFCKTREKLWKIFVKFKYSSWNMHNWLYSLGGPSKNEYGQFDFNPRKFTYMRSLLFYNKSVCILTEHTFGENVPRAFLLIAKRATEKCNSKVISVLVIVVQTASAEKLCTNNTKAQITMMTTMITHHTRSTISARLSLFSL
jgi:hypothetical protein